MIDKILDFFYPKKCALCGRLLEKDSLRGQQLGLCGHCDLSPYRIPFDGGEQADASEEAVACFRYEDRIRRAITRERSFFIVVTLRSCFLTLPVPGLIHQDCFSFPAAGS